MSISRPQILNIIAHRAAGNGIRQTAKLVEVNPNTVVAYSLRVGEGCARFLDRSMRGLAAYRLELDELHSHLHTKQRNLHASSAADHGDVWAYLAEDAVSRAIVSFVVDKRTRAVTQRFTDDIRQRVVGRLAAFRINWRTCAFSSSLSISEDIAAIPIG